MELNPVNQLKKVELHRHIEGCITLEFLKNFITEFYPQHELNEDSDLSNLYEYNDMSGFLKAYATVVDLINNEAHFIRLAQHVVSQLREENIIYAELIFSPQPYRLKNLSIEKILMNMYEVFSKTNIVTHVNIDFIRQLGGVAAHESFIELRDICRSNNELKHWITGISIGGDEMNFPPELFIETYKQAKEEGFKLYAHAGEWNDSQSVWNALQMLNADRVGHGINSIEDEGLLNYLKENDICLDISVTSNYFTGALPKEKVHPVVKIYKTGCKISLNTDDPGFFFTDLNQEYLKFIDMGFSINDIKTTIRNALLSSFADEKEREIIMNLISQNDLVN